MGLGIALIMTDKESEILQAAVARNVGAVLSLPSAGMLRHHKSRLLGESDGNIVLECPRDELILVQEIITTAKLVGVSFRSGVNKAIFAVPVLRYEQDWQINEGVNVAAVILQKPTELKVSQRRANYRVEIPMGMKISLRVWRIPERAYLKAKPMSAQEIKAELRDLSTGGIGVRLIGKDDQPPRIAPEDRLRLEITHGEDVLLIEGRMRADGQAPRGNTLMTGIQYNALENNLEGRKILSQLTRIVGELQRDEVRRTRAGLTGTG
jgi:c-di-GMP-binding flagellar brake protein YcgR